MHYLAQVVGKELQQFSMNSSVDTTELLGGFEQVDASRREREIASLLESAVDAATNALLVSQGSTKELHSMWSILCSRLHRSDTLLASEEAQSGGTVEIIGDQEATLIQALVAELQQVAVSCQGGAAGERVVKLLELLSAVEEKLSALSEMDRKEVSGCFEWIDGTLIRAMEQGQWLLIDNANFCNPTVLDRLNPLLEPNGKLLVNERGLVNGQVRIA